MRRSLVLLYVGLLLLGSVVPIGNRASDILMDNYTLDIRWDYLLHAFIYLPLPLILFYASAVNKGKRPDPDYFNFNNDSCPV